MRNEEMTIDVADPVFTKIIRSRQNDKNGLKMTVYVREKGQIIDLTGYAVKYEAMNQIGQFVRDDAQIVDAKNGVFSYTLSSQAVSTSDDWTAYFVMEKSTERMSTPDIQIIVRRDVKEGKIKIENYISEFDGAMERVKGYRKEIDEANQKIAALTPYIQKKVEETDAKCKGATERIQTRVDNVNKQIDAMEIVKKAGDTITGLLEYKSDHAIVLGSRSYKTVIHKGAQGELIFAPSTKEQGDTWDWNKAVKIMPDGIIKQATDTGWINLPTTGVENVPDRILKYKRSGEQISVIGSVKYLANTTVFATLPAGFRPVQHIAFPALAYGNGPTVCEVTVKSDGGMFLNGVQNGNIIHIALNFTL
ncbi:phage protein [Bacillus thuringiensis]|uniref:BppU family phage baseplate upper protein n=2 Tax=Bacillus thuringiensis TaxID=1428 RepID=UPI0018CCC15D|nr:BppU family phage baseplate upper protein [Bacillus thuringiensis]MBG9506972.1 phage protein [Bacillus thuringiensis]